MIIDRQRRELQAAFALIDALLGAEREARNLPGLSFSIVYDQEVLWSKGFGFANIEQRIGATPRTIYRIASVTKLFTATMLMQLRDAGRLHLDDPLEKYLPSGKVQSPFTDSSPVTFRQVVAHVAGLPRDDSVERVYKGNVVIFPSGEEIQANLKEMELIVPPMTKIQYSNLGFALLGLALEQIAGQSYTRYVTERILRPLGMESSGFEPVEEWPPSLQAYVATPYKPCQESEAVLSAAPVVVERGMNPAGGLYSSVEDIARFISLQFLDGPVQGKQILKGSTLREMHAPVFLDPNWNAATAIGWRIERMQNYTTIGHNGSISVFSSDVLIVPALKLGVALFANTATDASEIDRAILELLLPVFSRLLQRQ